MNTLILYPRTLRSRGGKMVPRKLTRSIRRFASECVVLDMDAVPPRVLVAPVNTSWPFYGGLLPDPFIDHVGNLRGGDGGVLLRHVEPNPNDLRVETKDHPFLTTPRPKLGQYSRWIMDRQTGATQSITPEDLSEFITVLDADQPKYLQP